MSGMPPVLRFGTFEFNHTTGELWNHGQRVALQDQPGRVLATLVTRAGKVVSREEIREAVWPEGTFVDFDASLSVAINKIRQALGDSANEPRFIETIPKRGYRFTGTLSGVVRTPEAPSVTARPASGRPWSKWALVGLGGAALAVIPLFWPASQGGSAADPIVRFEFPAPVLTTLPPTHSDARIAPNGQYVVFSAWERGRRVLYVRAIDALLAKPVPGTEGATHPFWSPDSRSIGFHAAGKLLAIDVAGGSPRVLCSVKEFGGGAWSSSRVIVFSSLTSLALVSDQGGVPTPLRVQPVPGPGAVLVVLQFLPDGRRFIYRVGYGAPGAQGAYLFSLGDGSTRRLFDLGVNVTLAASHLFFVQSRTLFAQPFDANRLTLVGEPSRVADQVLENSGQYSGAAVSVSDDGSVVYRKHVVTSPIMRWIDRSGRIVETVRTPARCANPEVSPNGAQVAMECEDPQNGQRHIWTLGAGSGTPTRLTEGPAGGSDPVWSPDAQWIAFSALKNRVRDVFRRRLSRPDGDDLLLESDVTKYPNSWSRDGRWLAVTSRGQTTAWDIWLLSMTDFKPHRLAAESYNEIEPQFSPDGKWLAYTTDQTGAWDLYLRPIGNGSPGSPIPIATQGGGSDPRWSPDGSELFYLSPDRRMLSVEVRPRGSGGVDISPPRDLFQTRTIGPQGLGLRFNYAVAARDRFLMSVAPDDAEPDSIVVVHRWMQMTR